MVLNYVLLPEDSYTLPCKIVVEAGQYVAAKTMINIKPFTKEMNESGEQYALPLRLYSKDKIVPTMKQSGIYVIATGSIIKFSAPILGHMTATAVDMTPGDITLNEYTVEMRFQIDKMGRNNQALFSATGIYIRLEDPAGLSNLIQIKGHGTYLNAITPFEANKWQHLAIVYNGSKYLIYVNGKLDAQKEVTPQPLTVSTMSICSSGSYFTSNCLVNEARLWDKALNESQIQNNATIVSPKAEGLVAYWKMTEGVGKKFKDATGHGYDATCNQETKWIHNILSTDVSSPWKNQ